MTTLTLPELTEGQYHAGLILKKTAPRTTG